MVFLTFRIRNVYQKEGDWNPTNKQANTTKGSENIIKDLRSMDPTNEHNKWVTKRS